MSPIYLDHNATAPLDPAVAEAMRACDAEGYLNPASQHQFGQRARRRLETARESIARLLGARTESHRADRVIFTSGGTEANNLAIFGLAPQRQAKRIIVSAIEHPSVAGPAARWAELGFDVERLRAGPTGVVDLDHLRELLAKPARLVSLMLANNETGVLQSVREAGKLAHEQGALLHCDAAQAVGRIDVHFAELEADAITIAAHKFHGPVGVGALLMRADITLQPMLWGGFQQQGSRPGSESVALVASMVEALQSRRDDVQQASRMTALRDRFEASLLAADPRAIVVGAEAPRLPQTSNIAFVGVDRQALAIALDLAGVAASTGSACASGSSEPSPTLIAMGMPEAVIRSALRFSLGAFTTAADLEQASERILLCVNNLRSEKRRGVGIA